MPDFLRQEPEALGFCERVNIGACVSDFCFYGQKARRMAGLISWFVCQSGNLLAQFFSEDRFQVDSGRFSPICFQMAMRFDL
ncbi:MAG: hypothetical protein ACLUHE_15710 [Christensenellales bacterium]